MNKNVFITGGSKGLGYELAKSFVKNGDNVFITSRNKVELKSAYENLKLIKIKEEQKIAYKSGDIYKDCYSLFRKFIKIFNTIDVLINNAATYGELGKLEDVSIENWSRAIETNLIAPVLLTKLSVKHMRENGKGKIVQISGGGATSPLSNMSAYATSKAAVVRFVECMSLELKDYNIDINAVSPGIMNTSLVKEVFDNPEKVDKNYYENMKAYKDYSFSHPVDLIMFLASEKSDGITGKIISAKYDKWQEFENHKDDISNSDAYTLRRVTGSQRGFEWDDLGAK